MQQTADHYRVATPPAPSPIRRLVDVPAYAEADYADRLHEFRTRLEAMVAYCGRVGALMVLVIPPGNDADFEPNRSFLPPETSRADREAFARSFQAARGSREADPAGGIAAYHALLRAPARLRRDPLPIGPVARGAGSTRRGGPALRGRPRSRRVPDALHVRLPGRLSRGRGAAPGAILIDGPAVFRGLSPRGTAGDDFFADGLHPSLIGYTGLAEAILRGLHAPARSAGPRRPRRRS